MGINDKTRKLLWGRAGSRCSICKCNLIVEATTKDDDSIVGDECHIISSKQNGPRHDPNFPKEEIDNYSNLLLLCRVDHKKIDDQYHKFSVDELIKIKKNHEEWVKSKLNNGYDQGIKIKREKGNIPEYLTRINTGKELTNLIYGTCHSYFSHENLNSETEVETIGDFFQYVQDYGDLLGDLGAKDVIRTEYDLDNQLKELANIGFWIFGAEEKQYLTGNGKTTDWKVVHMKAIRKSNVDIVKINL